MAPRLLRPIAIGVLGGLLLAELVVQLQMAGPDVGQDFRYDRAWGARWLETGAFYDPHQLQGPYDLKLMVDVLYPPIALLLFAPLALLPEPLAAAFWWGVPIAILAATTRRRWWVWLIVLLWPRALGTFVFGNSDAWAAAGVAAGLCWGWPAALLLLKPVFAPFAIVGVWSRSWWFAVGLLALLFVVAAPLWIDYVTVMQNVRGLGLNYSLPVLPLIVAPLLVADEASLDRLRAPLARRLRFTSETRDGGDGPVETLPSR